MPDGSPITNVGDKRYRASTQSRTRNLSLSCPTVVIGHPESFLFLPAPLDSSRMDSRLKLAGMTGRGTCGQDGRGGGQDGRDGGQDRKEVAGRTEGVAFRGRGDGRRFVAQDSMGEDGFRGQSTA